MATIVTRAGKGSPLTNTEVDANFNNLNDGITTAAAITGGTINGVQIGNTAAATIANVDNLRLDGNTLSSTNTDGHVIITPNGTGGLGINGDPTGVVAGNTIISKFCVKHDGGGQTGGFVHANNTTASSGAGIFACRSRGTTASPTAVQNNDNLATISFAGHDGTDLALAAQIIVEVDAAPGNNDMPGRISFLTTPDGTQSPAEAVRIDSSQIVTIRDALRFADADASNYVAFKSSSTVSSNVTWTLPAADGTNGQVLSTNGTGTLSWASGGGGGSSISAGDSKVEVTDTGSDGKITGTADNTAVFSVEKGKTFVLQGGVSSTGVGIAFPADQTTVGASTNANTLDDYEEGEWTISLNGNTTYNNRVGRYVKIGKLVYCTFFIHINTQGTGTQNSFSGLPFTASGNVHSGYTSFFTNLGVNTIALGFYVNSSLTTAVIVGMAASAASVTNGPNIFADNAQLYGSVTYITAD
jgi:hypothetical protein